ncbi:family 2 encapsulin nanocompartment cargo protein polyprenyl transferase [Actinomadura sp. DC4]|uniref:family 2 encapsulin nanocompartment cargo protein polyprenyl transferase n=1 Tax=Actinomadura sp. DC4 TaxID=3055069 RepID=UPI0025B053B3|nr:family 2 encapsulin nanocompartment cargo protein polyprenyl transferase [Actinomadura sp. DC4]MDN3357343.1 family 2 encapsulin nanocompartment cargo protein polyprenyl transferase [Actinomadura sp. DC4]
MTTTDESRAARTAAKVLAWSRSTVEPALRAAVDTLPSSMRLVAGHHYGWWDERGEPVQAAGGKAIRPTLTLLAAEAVGGDPAVAVPAAVAVELVHSFSLLHDDVMDGDRTRRHRPTTWAAFGVGPAILGGDALLTLAFDVLAASDHPAAADGMRRLSAAVQDLVDGQSADMAFETRADVDLRECLTMAEGKTAALLGCACALGAFYGGRPDLVPGLGAFGDRLGLAFQLVDDLLGIWGDPEVTGKAVYADLRQRKKSLPVVAALTSNTPAGHEFADLYHRETSLTDDELVHAAGLIELAGGRTWCRRKADDLLTEALSHLRSTAPADRPAAELTALADLVTRRDH